MSPSEWAIALALTLGPIAVGVWAAVRNERAALSADKRTRGEGTAESSAPVERYGALTPTMPIDRPADGPSGAP